MRRLTDWLIGWSDIALDGANLHGCLNRMTAKGIPFWNVCFRDEFTLRICVYIRDCHAVRQIAQGCMCNVCEQKDFGLPVAIRHACKRIPLALFLVTVATVCLWLSSHIWFFTVEGNVTIPAEQIIRAVNECGVMVGTKRKSIEPQVIKDLVLEKMPNLAWLTVTQHGSCAKIVVREKELPQGREDRRAVRNLVASADGIVEEMTVLDGAAVVKPGDTVKAGDLLISGYMDLEYKIRATRAEGEVFARTWRQMTMKTPVACNEKVYTGKKLKKYSLIFGNYQIKLSSSSGISAGVCDKMIEYIPATLPGGLKLPIVLVREKYSFYEKRPFNIDADDLRQMLTETSRHWVETSMLAGKIRNHTGEIADDGQIATLDIVFECREMIASPASVGIFKDE